GGHASMLASKLIDYGFDVKLMQVPNIPVKNLKNPSFAVISTFKGLVSREKHDIVHAFNVPSAFAMRYAKSRKKVLSIHGVFSDQIKALHSSAVSSIASGAESRVLKWADRLTTDSKITQKIYKEKLGFDFEYLPSAIDTTKLDKINDVEKTEKQIIYLGRDSYEKGIDILQKIESKLDGNVVYCTDLSWNDAMIELKKSSILVVPSRMESSPTSIKEAFYFKIPVVATNVGGIPELITDNHTGLLVPYDDSEKLVKVINNLLSNLELSNSLSKEAYNFVINHMTWKKVLPKYIDFYTNLLNS
ncbi:MAG: glycosyltransferase family 4 protein, partial [Thaumarchaeota archaeon]|nr:glycosyltransferase family 4 protein [Nitrososphaerota archaeon]